MPSFFFGFDTGVSSDEYSVKRKILFIVLFWLDGLFWWFFDFVAKAAFWEYTFVLSIWFFVG